MLCALKANREKVLKNDRSRTKKVSRRSKNFMGQKSTKNQKDSLAKNLQLWFSAIFCPIKIFDPRDTFLVDSQNLIPIGSSKTFPSTNFLNCVICGCPFCPLMKKVSLLYCICQSGSVLSVLWMHFCKKQTTVFYLHFIGWHDIR